MLINYTSYTYTVFFSVMILDIYYNIDTYQIIV
jgi:hypothetical protein